MNPTYYSVVPSAIGPLTLRWSGGALTGVHFDDADALARRREWVRDDACLEPVRTQIEEYFRGERRVFDLPLAFQGTPFQERVWRALVEIPFGTTTSYGELARRIGRPDWPGARAVGAANGQNPIAVIVPCHRVIGADGSLTGYAGGLPRKSWLLAHEGVTNLRAHPLQTSLL
ncbi:MAG: methylated-DNA--[protein]-cysteine S-methyltransferase [Myxococcales bacterium]|nr:methylated-DNA--[protein]-cysteine S-methyltransferase [Myxococcales bacterium]